MSKNYFGTDGVRGKVGDDPMTADFAMRLASAAAQVLVPTGGTVVIGKDTRLSGYMFESALEAGFVAAGADVLTGTAQMVVGSISVADEAGVPWFGTQANQSSLSSVVLASQVYKWEVVLRDILLQMDGGALGGTTYVIDFENGGLVLEYNEDAANPVPDDVRALADQVIADIISGAISPTG